MATVWKGVSCHQSQVTAYARLKDVSEASHEALWGRQSFYRVVSLVTVGASRRRNCLPDYKTDARLSGNPRIELVLGNDNAHR